MNKLYKCTLYYIEINNITTEKDKTLITTIIPTSSKFIQKICFY